MVKYFKQMKEEGAESVEVTKEEARHTLDGWWKPEALDEIFNEEKGFRLYTPYSEVWTQTEDGKEPMAGFYGTVG